MENHNLAQPDGNVTNANLLEQIRGNAAAPYMNSLITPGNSNAAQTSWASAYHNVLATPSGNNPSIHPSEPNYLWQEAGTNFGVLNGNDPYASSGANIQTASHLTGLLQSAGIAWKAYQEDTQLAVTSGAVNNPGNNALTGIVAPQSQWTVPAGGYSGTSAGYTNSYNGSHQYQFASKHDGTLLFTDTNGGTKTAPNNAASNPEVPHYAPLQQLALDLASGTTGRYNLITPDHFNDAHTALDSGFTYKGTHYTGDAANIAQGDNFLSILIPQIQASAAYKNNGVIILWWDETEASASEATADDFAHTLPAIIISPLAKGNAYQSTVNYTHSSDLKTMQELFGVTKNGFLGDAAAPGTNDFSDMLLPGTLAAPEPSPLIVLACGILGIVTLRARLFHAQQE